MGKHADFSEKSKNKTNESGERKNQVTIPVMEEKVQVDKEVVESGSVYITKDVEHSKVKIDTKLNNEEVDIKHVPINKFVEIPPGIRHEGETTIIPVLKEVVVKQTMLIEELHITKKVIPTDFSQDITLRKENINIKRVNNKNTKQN